MIGLILRLFATGMATWLATAPFQARADVIAFDASVVSQAILEIGTANAERLGNLHLIEHAGPYAAAAPPTTDQHESRRLVAQAYFQHFADDRDFLVVFTDFDVDFGTAKGIHWHVRNDVQGIGRELFDGSAAFGSNGRLRAYIDMGGRLSKAMAPHQLAYDDELDVLMHEIMHQWGVYVRYRNEAGASDDGLLGHQGGHWSYFADTDASVMYGSRWQALGPELHRAIGVRERYGPLDLYLAGFLPADGAPSIRLIRSLQGSPSALPQLGATSIGPVETVELAQIVAIEGPRIPAYTDAPTAFDASFVLLVRPGVPPHPQTLGRLETFRLQAQTRFAALTLGRGVLRTRVATAGGIPEVGEPVTIGSSLALRPVADLGLAGPWLLERQHQTGYWQDKPSTRIGDTVIAAVALRALEGDADAVERAAAWLAEARRHTVEEQAVVVRSGLLDADDAGLTAQMLADGYLLDQGWGMHGGFTASTVDTALAVEALFTALSAAPDAFPPADVANWRDAVPGLLRGDCWTVHAEVGRCHLLATTAGIRAVAASGFSYADVPSTVDRLLGWQNADGGFGDGASSEAETADALLALSAIGAPRTAAVHLAEDFLARRQRADGSWAGSVATSAKCVLALLSGQRPDLRVRSATLQATAPVHAGDPVTMRIQVDNAGGSATPPVALRVRYVHQDRPDVTGVIDSIAALPALDPGQQEVIAGEWRPEGLPAGEYRIEIRVDPDNLIQEANEENNAAELVFTLADPPQLPDLDFAPSSVVLSPGVIVQLPASVSLSAQVRNRGLTPVAAATVRVQLVRGTQLLTLAQTEVAGLDGLSAQELQFSFDIEHADATALLVDVDPQNQVVEADESNNQVRLPIRRDPTVDLAVRSGDLTVEPGVPVTGADVEIGLTVRNHGTEISPPMRLLIEVEIDGSRSTVIDQSIQLSANAARTFGFPWRPVVAGQNIVHVTLDPDNLVVEIDENNNVTSLAVPVKASTLPNLTLHREDIVLAPDPPMQGQSLQVSARVINTGAVAAEAFTVGYYLGDPDQGGERFAETSVPEGLATGATLDVSANLPSLERTGELVVSVRADDGAVLAEVSETDNSGLVLRTIRRLPDLSVREGDVVLDPSTPVPGEPNRVLARITNLGQQPSGPFDVVAYLGRPEAGGTPVASPIPVEDLAPGQSRLVQFAWQPQPDGVANAITVVVDPVDAVREGSESNNRAEVPFDLRDGDHFLTEGHFSPNGDGVKDRTRIVARFAEPTDARVRIVAEWGEEVRRYEGPELEGATALTLEWDGLRDDGTRAHDGEYGVIVETAAGEAIRRHRLVLDTDRLPLLLAAGTEYELATGLDCGLLVVDELNPEPQFTGDPRGSVIAKAMPPGEQRLGLYEVPLDGRPKRLILSPAELAFAGHDWEIQQWKLLDDGRTVLATAWAHVAGVDEHRVVRIDLQGGSVVPLASPLPSTYGRTQLVGASGDGDIVLVHDGRVDVLRPPAFDEWHGRVTDWHLADTGAAVRIDLGRSDFIALMQDQQYAQTARWVQVPLDASQPPRVLGSAGATSGQAFGSDVIVDRANEKFYFTSGYLESGEEFVSVIDLGTGAVNRLLDTTSTGSPARFTLTRSPHGGHLMAFEGVSGRMFGIDPGDGSSRSVDVLGNLERPLPPTGDNPVYYFDDFRWSEDGRRLMLDFVTSAWRIDQSITGGSFGCCWDRHPTTLELRMPIEAPATVLLHVGGNQFASPPFPTSVVPGGSFAHRLRALPFLPGEPQFVIEGQGSGVLPNFGVTPVRAYRTAQLMSGRVHTFLGSARAGRTILTRTAVGSVCPNHDHVALESLMNATTRLDIAHIASLGSLELRATAMDRYLDRFDLEYRPADAGAAASWNGILSERRGVVDEIVTYWAPPAPGRYDVRLSVQDRAGNVQSTQLPVSWFELSALGTVQLTERHFSPNGDGVKDATAVQFTLYRPAQFEIRIENEQGGVLRIQTLTFASAPPAPQQWLWDGRDGTGMRVPDGRYRVVVDGRVLWVTVDTVPPSTSFGWLSYLRAFRVECGDPFRPDPRYHCRSDAYPGTVPHLTPTESTVSDPHLIGIDLEWAERDTPGNWDVLAALLPTAPGLFHGQPSHHLLADHHSFLFRLHAEDAAGNATLKPLGWSPELFLAGMLAYAESTGDTGWTTRFVVAGIDPGAQGQPDDSGFTRSAISSQYPIDHEQVLFFIADTQAVPQQNFELWVAEDPRASGGAGSIACSALNALEWQSLPHEEIAASSAASFLPTHAYEGASRAINEGWRLAAVHGERFQPDRGYLLRLVAAGGTAHQGCDALAVRFQLAQPSAFHTGGAPGARYSSTFGLLRHAIEALRAGYGDDVAIDLRTLYSPVHWEVLSAQVDWQWRSCDGGVLVSWDRLASSTFRIENDHILFDARGMNYGGLSYAADGETLSGGSPRYTLNLSMRNRWTGQIVHRHWQQQSPSCSAVPAPSPLRCELSGATHLRLSQAIPAFNAQSIYRARLEGAEPIVLPTAPSNPGQGLTHLRVDISGVPEGDHTLVVDRQGLGNNWEEVARHTITVDRDPPSVHAGDIEVPALVRLCRFVSAHDCRAEPLGQRLRGLVSAADNHHLASVRLWPWQNGEPLPIMLQPRPLWLLAENPESPFHTFLDSDLAVAACSSSNPFTLGSGTVEFVPEARDCELTTSGEALSVAYQIDDSLLVSEARMNGLAHDEWQENLPQQHAGGVSLEAWARIPVSSVAGIEAGFSFLLGEAASGRVELVPTRPDGITWVVDGAPIAVLHDGPMPAGPWAGSWDGLDLSGQVVADRAYALRVQLEDECGHQSVLMMPIRVDNTPPSIAVEQPQPQAVLGPMEAVEAAVSDPSLGGIDIHYRLEQPEQPWRLIASNAAIDERNPPGTVRRLAWWNTSTLSSGPYQLRVRATDTLGHSVETVLPVELPSVAPLLRDARAEPGVFSPNDDGLRDSVGITIDLAIDALVRLEAFRMPENELVASLVNDQPVAAGVTQWHWDGRGAVGAVLADGRYALRLRVQSLVDPGQQQLVDLLTAIDTRRPDIALVLPGNGHSQGDLPLVLSLSDAHPRNYQARLAPPPGIPDWNGTQFGMVALSGLAVAAEGAYTLEVMAVDHGENSAQAAFPLVIDRTPPQAILHAPASGSHLAIHGGPVAVRGVANDAHFAGYRLALATPGSSPSISLLESSTPPQGDLLFHWTPAQPDGEYELVLSVRDLAGWEREDRVAVVIDNTPPHVEVTAPEHGGHVAMPVRVEGTVADSNIDRYEVQLAPTSTAEPVWSTLVTGTAPVAAGLIAELGALPVEGEFRVRVLASDHAGNEASQVRTFRVDGVPPEAATQLSAERVGVSAVRLSWQASTASDLSGYRVLRNGLQHGAAAAGSTSFDDVAVPDGEQRYRLIAIDHAGNSSVPSNEARVRIDTTPPEVRILMPIAGARIRADVEVWGTAYSPDDFGSHWLDASGADFALRLAEATVPARAERLATWDTSPLTLEADATLALSARDQDGNEAVDGVTVTIDNVPPVAPTGLMVAGEGGGARLTWNPNTEADLAGYLVYRGAELLNGNATSDPRLIAIPQTTWLDDRVGDGDHAYRVVAVDQAANLSPPSDPAEIGFQGRPPTVVFERPVEGHLFEHSLVARVRSEHLDIVSVEFAVRAIAGGGWSALGAPVLAQPWQMVFDAVGLPYGDYQLRATATDSEGLVDPDPPVRLVRYRDLTAPSPVDAFAAMVDGGDVSLSWQAPADADLDRFELARRLSEPGQVFEVVAEPDGTASGFTDSGRADARYEYAIVAVDGAGNRSVPAMVQAMVHTPHVDYPYTPTSLGATSLCGRALLAGQVVAERHVAGNTLLLPEQMTDGQGAFCLEAVELLRDVNEFRVRIVDLDGARSKAASIIVRHDLEPPAPNDVSVMVDDFLANLSWSEVNEGQVLGYRVFRNGEPVVSDRRFGESGSPRAGYDYEPIGHPAPRLFDGDPGTGMWYWLAPEGMVWIEQDYAEPVLVPTIAVDLSETDPGSWQPVNIVVFGWSGEAWIRLHEQLAVEPGLSTLEPEQPYRSRRWRIELHAAADALPLQISEVRIDERPLIAGTAWQETLGDGIHRYRVAAVHGYAFEGPKSAVVEALIGDWQPPEPVQLMAEVADADVTLSWSESSSGDAATYLLLRRGALLAESPASAPRSHVDIGLANGSYDYQVVVRDHAGNLSAPSNRVDVVISEDLPAAPVELVVSAVAGGGALDMTWQPGAGALADRYRIYRGLVAGGPHAAVVDVAGTSHRDSGLENGRRYYYVVHAVDIHGNLSAASNEASGIPATAQALARPSLVYPGRGGASVQLSGSRTVASGWSTPGAEVRVLVDGSLSATSVARPTTGVNVASPHFWVFPSPDARHLLVNRWGELDLHRRGEPDPLETLGAACSVPQWINAGSALLCRYGTPQRIVTYSIANGSESVLATAEAIHSYSLSPDRRTLLLAGTRSVDGALQDGLWLLDIDGSAWQFVAHDASWEIDGGSIRWSEDARFIAWRTGQPGDLEVFDRLHDVVVGIAVNGAGPPSFLPAADIVLVVGTGAQGPALYRVDLPAGDPVPVALVGAPTVSAALSSDGTRLAQVDEGGDLVLRSWPAMAEIERQPLAADYLVEFIGNGELLLRRWTMEPLSLQVTPAGHFQTGLVDLPAGRSVLTAYALKPGNGISPLSLPVELWVPAASALPDLAVLDADVRAWPSVVQVGMPTQAIVRVRNPGNVQAPPSHLRVVAAAPDGSLHHSEDADLPGIAAGGHHDVAIAIGAAVQPGQYRLTAIADVNQLVAEVDEGNNLGIGTWLAARDDQPELALELSHSALAPGAVLNGTATAIAVGSGFNGRLSVRVLDAQGYLVAALAERPVTLAGAGQQAGLDFDWTTAGTLAGSYRVQARLRTASGILLRDIERTVTVRADMNLTVSVEPDAADVALGSPLDGDVHVSYLGGNVLLTTAQLHLRLLDALGHEHDGSVHALGSLAPGNGFHHRYRMGAALTAPGPYQLIAELRDGTLIAQGAASVNVQAAAGGGLRASLLLPAAAVPLGDELVLGYRLENQGTAPIAGLQVRLTVYDVGLGTTIAAGTQAFDLESGATSRGALEVSPTALRPGQYVVALDRVDQVPIRRLAIGNFGTVDASPPTVSIVAPSDGAVVAGTVDLEALASDAHSTIAAVRARINGGPWLNMSASSPLPGRYLRFLSGLPEGSVSLEVQAEDGAGNQAITDPRSLSVDRTPPMIAVNGVEADGHYNHTVVPEVSAGDAHLVELLVSLNGQAYVSGTEITAEGSYVLFATARDAAGNRSQIERRFRIDLTPPGVVFLHPTPGAVVAVPSVDVHGSTEALSEVFLSAGTHQVQGSADAAGAFSIADVPLQLGENTLTAVAVDRAGNQGPPATLLVHRVEPGAGELTGELVPDSESFAHGTDITGMRTLRNVGTAVVSDVSVRLRLIHQASGDQVGVHSDIVTLGVGGEVTSAFAFPTVPLLPQPHRLLLEAYVDAGRGGSDWVTLDDVAIEVVDVEPPLLVVLHPVGDAVLATQFEVRVEATDGLSGVSEVAARLGEQAWQPLSPAGGGGLHLGMLSGEDGPHLLAVRAMDGAGNVSEAPAATVVIDSLPPEIVVTGVTDGQIANTPLTPFVTVEDPHLASVSIRLDGLPFVSGTEVTAEGQHFLEVSGVDEAGNSSVVEVVFALDFTAPAAEILAPADGSQVSTATIGAIIQTEAQALVDLEVGATHLQHVAGHDGRAKFPAVPLDLGTNTIRVRARDAAGNIGPETSVVVVRVSPGSAVLVGVLTGLPASAVPGESLPGSWQVGNAGSVGSEAQVVRLRAVDANGVLPEQTWPIPGLAPSATISENFVLNTTAWLPGDVTVELHTRPQGEPGANDWQALATHVVRMKPAQPAALHWVAPEPDSTVGERFRVEVLLTDAPQAPSAVESRMDAGAWHPMQPGTEGNRYHQDLRVRVERWHRFEVRALLADEVLAEVGPIRLCVDLGRIYADDFESMDGLFDDGFEHTPCPPPDDFGRHVSPGNPEPQDIEVALPDLADLRRRLAVVAGRPFAALPWER